MNTQEPTLYLTKRVPEQNHYRFYAIRVNVGIFEDWAVIREWGRIGSPGTVRSLWFKTRQEAETVAETIGKKKLKRGYQLEYKRVEKEL